MIFDIFQKIQYENHDMAIILSHPISPIDSLNLEICF